MPWRTLCWNLDVDVPWGSLKVTSWSWHQMWFYTFAPSGPVSWARYQMWCYARHSTKCTTVCQLITILHGSTITSQWVFRVESCLWLCCGFLGLNPTSSCVMDFWVVCLSILFVPTLCLKDPQTKNDTIHLELLLMVRVIRWNEVAWVLATQKTRRTLHQQLTIIYCSMFRLHTVAQERERERERERESIRVYERTQRDTSLPAWQNSLNANF